jgi:ribosomal protein S27E
MTTRWLRFTCPTCRHISETLDRGQLREACKACGAIVEAVPFTTGEPR